MIFVAADVGYSPRRRISIVPRRGARYRGEYGWLAGAAGGTWMRRCDAPSTRRCDLSRADLSLSLTSTRSPAIPWLVDTPLRRIVAPTSLAATAYIAGSYILIACAYILHHRRLLPAWLRRGAALVSCRVAPSRLIDGLPSSSVVVPTPCIAPSRCCAVYRGEGGGYHRQGSGGVHDGAGVVPASRALRHADCGAFIAGVCIAGACTGACILHRWYLHPASWCCCVAHMAPHGGTSTSLRRGAAAAAVTQRRRARGLAPRRASHAARWRAPGGSASRTLMR
jgi:hypothetical protein